MLKINQKTQFYTDLSKEMMINNNKSSLGYWNLIVSIRDCGLYACGIKPHRNWKISDVKKYFGIKGNATELKTQLGEMKEELLSQLG